MESEKSTATMITSATSRMSRMMAYWQREGKVVVVNLRVYLPPNHLTKSTHNL